jgi:hypothetical protein
MSNGFASTWPPPIPLLTNSYGLGYSNSNNFPETRDWSPRRRYSRGYYPSVSGGGSMMYWVDLWSAFFLSRAGIDQGRVMEGSLYRACGRSVTRVVKYFHLNCVTTTHPWPFQRRSCLAMQSLKDLFANHPFSLTGSYMDLFITVWRVWLRTRWLLVREDMGSTFQVLQRIGGSTHKWNAQSSWTDMQ